MCVLTLLVTAYLFSARDLVAKLGVPYVLGLPKIHRGINLTHLPTMM